MTCVEFFGVTPIWLDCFILYRVVEHIVRHVIGAPTMRGAPSRPPSLMGGPWFMRIVQIFGYLLFFCCLLCFLIIFFIIPFHVIS